MINNELDELDPSNDPHSLIIQDFDIRGVVFVIPVDAPLPSEIADITLPNGSLYKRLAALDMDQLEEFAIVPISGAEMLALERVWRTLQSAKRVFVLMDIPAARYDVLFTQALRQIGLPTVEWPSVADALASRVRTVQRTTDKEPWNAAIEETRPRRKLPITSTEDDSKVPDPSALPGEDD